MKQTTIMDAAHDRQQEARAEFLRMIAELEETNRAPCHLCEGRGKTRGPTAILTPCSPAFGCDGSGYVTVTPPLSLGASLDLANRLKRLARKRVGLPEKTETERYLERMYRKKHNLTASGRKRR